MSGFRSTRSVRFVPEGSHAAGGQNGPDHRCDWVASSEEVELRGGCGAVGDERAALSPVARRLRGAGRGGDCGAGGGGGLGPGGAGRGGGGGPRWAPGRAPPVDEVAWVVDEFFTRYFDFTAKHFHEAIQSRPMADGKLFVRSYTWTKSVLQQRGLVTKAAKRSAHRKKRARRPLPGMLVFQDG